MSRFLSVLCVFLVIWEARVTGLSRQKRIIGGEPASPPPPGASEVEDVVENPALVAYRVPNATTTTTTVRPRPRPSGSDGGPIVFLRRGRREARVTGVEEEGVYAFKGIRYAEPPKGFLRFQRPRRRKMEGEIAATAPGPPCPQTIGDRFVGNEDCLFLNVFSPELPKDSQSKGDHPVVFWIHGGGFRHGSGSQYGVKDLVKQGVVVVTVQYRLGSLGFLSTNRKELPGNAGLFDIIASLSWVRKYIQFFGGDPKRIFPSGQGSGASVATMLALAQFSKGWIKGVFAMSGSAISSFAVDKEPGQTGRSVAELDSCQGEQDDLAFVRCMQRLPVETIVRGDDKLQERKLSEGNKAQTYLTSISQLLNPGPAVEGEDDMRFLPNFLTSSPANLLQRSDLAKVPLLTGVTKDETSTSAKGGGIATKLLGGVEATEEMLESLVPQLLNINSGVLGDSLNPLVKQLFSNNGYLKGITSSLNGVASALDKIIEMTTDALFNMPAFLTSSYWSKQNKVYLYRFEHESQTSSADDFLQNYPLTEQEGDKYVQGVGHGDDLIYLFDVHTVEGQPVEGAALTNPEDLKVRQLFTKLVAEFARTGEPKVNGRSVTPFTEQNGEYLVVKPEPEQAMGFRKCQMGLWAGLTEVLKSTECSFLQLGDVLNSVVVGGLSNITKGATDGLNKTASSLTEGLTGGSGLGGLTGNGGSGLGGLTGNGGSGLGGLTGNKGSGLGGLTGNKGSGLGGLTGNQGSGLGGLTGNQGSGLGGLTGGSGLGGLLGGNKNKPTRKPTFGLG